MNKEFVCELVRAHYRGDDGRVAVLVEQLARDEDLRGSAEVAARLRACASLPYGQQRPAGLRSTGELRDMEGLPPLPGASAQ